MRQHQRNMLRTCYICFGKCIPLHACLLLHAFELYLSQPQQTHWEVRSQAKCRDACCFPSLFQITCSCGSGVDATFHSACQWQNSARTQRGRPRPKQPHDMVAGVARLIQCALTWRCSQCRDVISWWSSSFDQTPPMLWHRFWHPSSSLTSIL